MYNDEKNLYHYTYRKSGREEPARDEAPVQNSTPAQDTDPVQETAPVQDTNPSIESQLHDFRQSGQPRQQVWAESAGPAMGPQPEAPKAPKAKKTSPMGLKIAALALSCAILGGAAGAGVTAAVKSHSGSGTATVNVSDRTASQVVLKSVDGKTELTDAENYAANVNSVVSINCSATATNYFGQTVESASSGSGFVLTQDGFIVTNHHVIDGATSVKVSLYDGESYDATVIGSDSDYDIAVLKIDATDLTPVTLGDSSLLNVGDHVLAVGNPLGELTFSASEGIASSVNRTINVSGIPFNMIQVTCAVNPGNSGGPLFNAYGEVVGIVSAKYSSTASSSSDGESVEGLGFAIPINDVLAMIEDIMTNGYVTDKAYMGIVPGTMTSQMAAQYRYDISEGVFIYSVEENSPASEAGLQMGDVITAIDGKSIASYEELVAAKKGYSAGDTSTLTIYRGGKTMEVQLTWGAQPEDTTASNDTNTNTDTNDNGNNQYSQDDLNDLFRYFFGNRGYGYGG